MSKNEIIEILESIENSSNSEHVMSLKAKIQNMSDEEIQKKVSENAKHGKSIREILEEKIHDLSRRKEHENDKVPINDCFNYGIDGSCIHLHLPGDFHNDLNSMGMRGLADKINLYLLDALIKINDMVNNGESEKFKNIDSVFMISPILIKHELNFLKDFGFDTNLITKKQLNDEKFVKENPSSSLAIALFGTDKNVGYAKKNIRLLNNEEWKKKCEETMQSIIKRSKDKLKMADSSIKTPESSFTEELKSQVTSDITSPNTGSNKNVPNSDEQNIGIALE